MVQKDGWILTAITRLFNPDYCRTEKSIAIQLEEGKCCRQGKYPEMKYRPLFSALFYKHTYAELEGLKRKYEGSIIWMG